MSDTKPVKILSVQEATAVTFDEVKAALGMLSGEGNPQIIPGGNMPVTAISQTVPLPNEIEARINGAVNPVPDYNFDKTPPQTNQEARTNADPTTPEGMEWVVDTDRDTLVLKPITPVGSRSMYDREMELREVSELSTEMYNRDIVYYWVNSGKDGVNSQVAARKNGYVPIRDLPKVPHHLKKKVEGLGEVITLGDLALFGAPRRLVEERQEMKARIEWERNNERARGTALIEGLQDRFGAKNIYIKNEEWRKDLEQTVVASDATRADEMARSLEQAERFAGIRDDRGQRHFSGFDGPANQGAVPPSPFFRGR